MRKSNSQARSTVLPLIAVFAALFCIGCGGRTENRTTIRGEVRLNGKPLERGLIQFLPISGVEGSVASGEILQGRYRIPAAIGPAVGWNRVEITAAGKSRGMLSKPSPKRGAIEETTEAVAPRFNSQSTLRFEVQPGQNTADFEVTSR